MAKMAIQFPLQWIEEKVSTNHDSNHSSIELSIKGSTRE